MSEVETVVAATWRFVEALDRLWDSAASEHPALTRRISSFDVESRLAEALLSLHQLDIALYPGVRALADERRRCGPRPGTLSFDTELALAYISEIASSMMRHSRVEWMAEVPRIEDAFESGFRTESGYAPAIPPALLACSGQRASLSWAAYLLDRELARSGPSHTIKALPKGPQANKVDEVGIAPIETGLPSDGDPETGWGLGRVHRIIVSGVEHPGLGNREWLGVFIGRAHDFLTTMRANLKIRGDDSCVANLPDFPQGEFAPVVEHAAVRLARLMEPRLGMVGGGGNGPGMPCGRRIREFIPPRDKVEGLGRDATLGLEWFCRRFTTMTDICWWFQPNRVTGCLFRSLKNLDVITVPEDQLNLIGTCEREEVIAVPKWRHQLTDAPTMDGLVRALSMLEGGIPASDAAGEPRVGPARPPAIRSAGREGHGAGDELHATPSEAGYLGLWIDEDRQRIGRGDQSLDITLRNHDLRLLKMLHSWTATDSTIALI